MRREDSKGGKHVHAGKLPNEIVEAPDRGAGLPHRASECRDEAGTVFGANAYWHRENRRYRMAVHEERFGRDARVGALDELA